jgi:hypothetical protein
VTWKPLHEKSVAETPFTLLTLRAPHSHEVAHELVLGGRTLRVLPDGRTTARKRSYNISDALTAHGQLPETDLLALLVGWLVIDGATNLELDGLPLMAPTPSAQWRVLLNDDGSIKATYLGSAA